MAKSGTAEASKKQTLTLCFGARLSFPYGGEDSVIRKLTQALVDAQIPSAECTPRTDVKATGRFDLKNSNLTGNGVCSATRYVDVSWTSAAGLLAPFKNAGLKERAMQAIKATYPDVSLS